MDNQLPYQDHAAAQIRLSMAEEAQEVNLVSMLKPAITIDGNQWCVLYGKDLQSGVAGFGDSPAQAARDFNEQWYKKLDTQTTK
jgi:hypothetical protein